MQAIFIAKVPNSHKKKGLKLCLVTMKTSLLMNYVVSTITKKLVDAIGDLDKRLYDLETKLNGIDSKVNQIASRGVAPPSAASAAASAAPDKLELEAGSWAS
jgi:uncharacterized protein (DUF2342 family)